ncbi:hypothetical protein OIU34_37295 [Pararhizobium sp. BT-229]|uniref:hypothetical protein n=1 Tax=Pararhizobium sp. BT-229 TaxID=2986923 RepID=UPI0021F785A9|nr:hypothetical protein [Pararhizobium sp. BT-229]
MQQSSFAERRAFEHRVGLGDRANVEQEDRTCHFVAEPELLPLPARLALTQSANRTVVTEEASKRSTR